MSSNDPELDEIFVELRKKTEEDEVLRKKLKEAVRTKDVHWLRSLIQQVAEYLFGKTGRKLVELVEGAFDAVVSIFR